MKHITCQKPPLTSQVVRSLFLYLRQAEMEAVRFGNKDAEAFAQFFRMEVEKLTENISREEIISPNRIIEIIEKQGNIKNTKEFFDQLRDAGIAIRKSLLAQGKILVLTFMR